MYDSKLKRFAQKIFGLTSGDREMVEFGTPTEGRPIFIDKIQDPAAVQTKYYEQGWFPESLTGNIRPYAEDMNGVHFLHSYQLAYILQAGIPEWDNGTPYFKDCICRVGKVLYISNVDNNTDHNPISDTANAYWNVFTLGDSGVPVGASLEWNGLEVPNDKWHFEDGSFLDVSEYSELHDVIGDIYGSRTILRDGVEVEQFALPNSTGRVALGYKSGEGGYPLGSTGGQFNHQHFIPAHNHGIGSLSISQSGGHVHELVGGNHQHTIPAHQHKFRFGDNGGTRGSGINCATLGSAGKSGTDNNPTSIGWDNGTGTAGKGHFVKMVSPAIQNASQSATPDALKVTGIANASVACSSATHEHRSSDFNGVVGNPQSANGDSGTLLTISSNDATASSNMPYIVKRKIIRIKP